VSSDTHAARIDNLRAAFDQASARFLARYDTATSEEAVAAPPDGGWTAAQIAAHVSAVNRALSAIVSGRLDRATPPPEGFVERPWRDVAAGVTGRLQSPASMIAAPTVTRADARTSFEASRALVLETFAGLDETRARHIFKDSRFGAISLYQVGDFLTTHVARHNAQLKRVLGR
jgi:hypothetical protein